MRGGDECGYTLYTFNLVKNKITKSFFFLLKPMLKIAVDLCVCKPNGIGFFFLQMQPALSVFFNSFSISVFSSSSINVMKWNWVCLFIRVLFHELSLSNHVALNWSIYFNLFYFRWTNHRIPNLLGELLLRPGELFTAPIICCTSASLRCLWEPSNMTKHVTTILLKFWSCDHRNAVNGFHLTTWLNCILMFTLRKINVVLSENIVALYWMSVIFVMVVLEPFNLQWNAPPPPPPPLL